MIHRDWHDRQLRFQLEVGRWLAQVRRGAELAPVSGELYLISFFVIDKLSCDHVGKICQLPQLDTNKSGDNTGSGVSRTFFITLVASSTAATRQPHPQSLSYQQTRLPPAQPPPSLHPAFRAWQSWHSSL